MLWYEIVGFVILYVLIGLFVFLRVSDMIFGRKPNYLGVKSGQLAPMQKTPKGVCSYTDYPPQKMAPFSFQGVASEGVQLMIEILIHLPDYPRIKIYESTSNYLWAYDTSWFWRWKDDIEFYFDENTHLVQFRSSPRYGYTDGGFNRRRMERIQTEFKKKNQ